MINPAKLFDVDAYSRSGHGPWTIFAYPTSVADEQKLAHDEEALRFLAELLNRGLSVGIWKHPEIDHTVYLACPFEERERVHAAVQDLERSGEFPVGFAHQRSEHLFSLAKQAENRPIESAGTG